MPGIRLSISSKNPNNRSNYSPSKCLSHDRGASGKIGKWWSGCMCVGVCVCSDLIFIILTLYVSSYFKFYIYKILAIITSNILRLGKKCHVTVRASSEAPSNMELDLSSCYRMEVSCPVADSHLMKI